MCTGWLETVALDFVPQVPALEMCSVCLKALQDFIQDRPGSGVLYFNRKTGTLR